MAGSNWIDDFTTVVGGVTQVLEQVKTITSPPPPTTTATPATEAAKPATVTLPATLPAGPSPLILVGLGLLALFFLLEA